MYSLSIVLPACNEAPNLAQSVSCVLDYVDERGFSGQVIVVDDGSSDDTFEVAADLGRADPRVCTVRHGGNLGYGAALRSGFRAATGDLVFFTDADLQFDVGDLDALMPWIDRFDIVAGFRHQRRDPWNRRLNAWAWGGLVNALFDLAVQDVNCAFKLFHRRVLERLAIRSNGAFVNTEMLARARASGFSVRQVPVSHFPRSAGVQSGAQPRVVARAFVELARLYGDLHTDRAQAPVAVQHERVGACVRVY